MPIVNPNYSEAFKPIVGGVYTCKIVSCELKRSQQGNQYLNWRLETEPDNFIVYYSTPIEGRGAGMFKHLVKCTIAENYDAGPIQTDELLGKSVCMHLDVKRIESKGKLISVFEVVQVERLNQDIAQIFAEDAPF